MQGVTSGWGASLRGLGALISVTVRYPEVASVQYDPERGTLTVSFLLRAVRTEAQWSELLASLDDLLATYHQLIGHRILTQTVTYTTLEGITSLEFQRDRDTLSVEEVGLVIEFLREQFGQDVISDPHELMEEDLLLQEETINASLEALHHGEERRLIALREEGRVLVYNA